MSEALLCNGWGYAENLGSYICGQEYEPVTDVDGVVAFVRKDAVPSMLQALRSADALDLRDQSMVRAMAFAFDPMPFNSHAALYQYCIDKGDSPETAQQCADDTHQPDIDRVIAQTRRAIIALRAHLQKAERSSDNG